MQPMAKWALWLGGALVWVAGVAFALFALAAPSRAEMAFSPEQARLVCAGVQPETLKRHGNSVSVPASTERLRDCRVEIDFAVRHAAAAERAAEASYVELMGLKLARAAFPQRLAANGAGLALKPRAEGGLTLSVPFDVLFGGDRKRGAALILAWRSGDGGEAEAYLSPTLILERADAPAQLRARGAAN